MKIRKGLNLRNVCGEYIIVAEGKENIDFTSIISMNDSSAYLWKQLQSKEDFNEEDLVDFLMSEYDVDKETAQNDVKDLISQWNKAGIIF